MTEQAPHRLRILERSVYRGPHLYSGRPMIRIQIDLDALEARPTDTLPGFVDDLLGLLPGLTQHGCSLGVPGGFVQRLRDGTWMGHVIEHVALELQSRAGDRMTRGKTRSVRGRPGVYNVMYRYETEVVGLLAGRLAIELVAALLPAPLRAIEGTDKLAVLQDPPGVDVAEADRLLREARRKSALGPSTASLVVAARRRGIPVQRVNDQSLIQLGWGSRQRRLRASVTDRTGLVAAELAGDKAAAKAMLAAGGIPVAPGVTVRSLEEALAKASTLAGALVVKPLGGNHGRGVTVGVRSPDEVAAAFAEAVRHDRRVIIEAELPGADHRVLVVDGRVVAVAERRPPQVVGDGLRSVRDLVDIVNADPRRGEGHEAVLTKIRLDGLALDVLARQGLTPDSVPPTGQQVILRMAANLSSGGTAVDRTDDIHPDNAAICRRAALILGLDVAGIDLLAPDITRPVRETGGGIVEVNAAPGLRMHLAPSEGSPRDVAEPIVRMLFPAGARSRIPVLAVTGTNGKSTVGRMAAHILKHQGRTVGLTNTSGVYIGDERVATGDASGPKSARMVLSDPTVDVAVLECARGGILREGLAFDRCDVGAVLNIHPDHLGLKGVMSLKDLADVKSVVVESVGRRGVSVLNADDPLTISMARHAGGRISWFTMRGGRDTPPFVLQHLSNGGAAFVYDEATGDITAHDHGASCVVCHAGDIPATLGGTALFNVQNALAAAAMTHAIGVPTEAIGLALSSFQSTFDQNPGRMNVFDDHGFRVILDYAHNPEALRALGHTVSRLTPETARSVGMISIPGDRRDEEIRAMGEIGAEFFDVLVFRETPDGRGRPKGEVMKLMTKGALSRGRDPRDIHAVYEEIEAAEAALRLAQPGDVVVLTPTRVETVWEVIRQFRPKAAGDGAPVGTVLEPAHG